LDAAERCYERVGVTRTAVNDIADEAKIHRTTVYTYFSNRDQILNGVLKREMRPLIAEILEVLDGEDFPERIVVSIMRARASVRSSRFLSLLFDPESAALTVRVASSSETFRRRTVDGLSRFIEAARKRREVRDDVPADAVAEWIMRIVFMLMAEERPVDDEAVELLLRTFLVPSIARPRSGSARGDVLMGR
jgi:AcrR family transcriptional regulator